MICETLWLMTSFTSLTSCLNSFNQYAVLHCIVVVQHTMQAEIPHMISKTTSGFLLVCLSYCARYSTHCIRTVLTSVTHGALAAADLTTRHIPFWKQLTLIKPPCTPRCKARLRYVYPTFTNSAHHVVVWHACQTTPALHRVHPSQKQ